MVYGHLVGWVVYICSGAAVHIQLPGTSFTKFTCIFDVIPTKQKVLKRYFEDQNQSSNRLF